MYTGDRYLSPDNHDTRKAAELLREFRTYDIMEKFAEAEVGVPEGERFYDPIYEEVWD